MSPDDNDDRLNDLPSAHLDPPARSIGSGSTPRRAYDAGVPGGPSMGKAGGRMRMAAFGAVAIAAAAVGYFLLPKFGFGPGNGQGGVSPGAGGGSPPAAVVPSAAPTLTQPTAASSTTGPSTPSGPFHIFVDAEDYHVGAADGPKVTLDQVVEQARTSHGGQPIQLDVNGTSRAAAEQALKKALDAANLPYVWYQDGKPMTTDVP